MASGKRLFKKRLSATGTYYSSPIAVGDSIYLTSLNGVIAVLRAGDEYELLTENDLAEPIMATPAVVDGTLYVRTDKQLYAFRDSAKR